MPVQVSYPGVYIEEVPSGVRTITGVATSITAFIGRARRGPVNEPRRVQSFADFQRIFGDLWLHSTMSYSVQHFFLNGGADALIVRIHNGATAATISLPAGGNTLTLAAASVGDWGNNLRAIVNHDTRDADEPSPDVNLFNLIIEELDADGNVVNTETFRNLSRDPEAATFVTTVLEQESQLVRVQGAVPVARPDETPLDVDGNPIPVGSNNDGGDGNALTFAEYEGDQAAKTGIFALEKADLFNLLVIPPFTRDPGGEVADTTWQAALAYCKSRRAMLIVDSPPAWTDVASAAGAPNQLGLQGDDATNGAIYFPHVRMPDPLKENRLETFAPGGLIAGIYARTDAQRGVWKAPAGLDASMTGVREFTVKMTDGENGQLNPLGINCLRAFPVVGNLVWGARTIRGADRLASEWKYVPVRRLALFIEESLYRGTQWVVFEPNDEPLWSQIRLNVGAFMQNLFRQGAFAGKTPRDAYLVKCDKETTTQNDIRLGIVNILVGFAPLIPAEFVILKISQLAGQQQT